MSEFDSWPWFAFYREAVLELNREKQPARIELAERVIAARMNELEQNPKSSPEQEALHNALGALAALKRRLPH